MVEEKVDSLGVYRDKSDDIVACREKAKNKIKWQKDYFCFIKTMGAFLVHWTSNVTFFQ